MSFYFPLLSSPTHSPALCPPHSLSLILTWTSIALSSSQLSPPLPACCLARSVFQAATGVQGLSSPSPPSQCPPFQGSGLH